MGEKSKLQVHQPVSWSPTHHHHSAMVKFILIKSPDEWATTKRACRDELVVYLFFIYGVMQLLFYIYIYIYIYNLSRW